MPDLLVRLYDLPDIAPILSRVREAGVETRRALAPERHIVSGWAAREFSQAWADEVDIAFSRQPLACYIAIDTEGRLVGFAAYDATQRNFFGPLGVSPHLRGRSVGLALLLSGLHAMRNEGYAYAIIGGAGPVEFFRKAVAATVIEDSSPGIYRGMLRKGQ